MADKVYLTQAGYKKLKDELARLKSIDRVDVASKIKDAREIGDILENSVYDAAVDEQSYIEGRISEIEDMLTNAKVISSKHSKHKEVQIGCTVIVASKEQQHQFTLVGIDETDPEKNHISYESPVGKALLGAKLGDEVEVVTPQLTAKYKVLEIK